MTRKDYIRIAEAIKEARLDMAARGTGTYARYNPINQVVVKLCRVLAADNGQFDSERFIRACEGKQ